VVADSQCTSSSGSKTRVRKLARIPGLGVFGGAGDFLAVLTLRDWAIAGFEGKRPSKTSEAECLLVKDDGSVWYLSGTGQPFEILDEFTAIGSGAGFAEGAMAYGASALEAVKIAADRDSGTSGPFQQMRIKRKRRDEEE
jgi:hypothetical protein